MKSKFTKIASLLVLAIALVATGCGDNGNDNPTNGGSEPSISSFSPTSGTVGTSVTIDGQNFATSASGNTVTFSGGAEATVNSASGTQLEVTVPDGAETGPISVAVGSASATSSSDFTVEQQQQVPQVYQDLPGNKTLITDDETWANDTTVAGPHYVLPGATLTVEEGVTVTFEYHNDVAADVGTIITLPADDENFSEPRPSGRLVARGSADNPIVFTSTEKTVASWGGIILAGEASNNVVGGQGEIEGLSSGVAYGADTDGGESFNDQDDSGVLSYVQINYSGYSISDGSELQALTLYSVGSETELNHISVFKSVDDGIEFFGGTVDVKYFVVVDAQDDTFDGDQGWTGRGQFWLGVTTEGTPGNRGWENDGCADVANCNGGNGPTEYKVYNATMYGNGTDYGEGNVDGIFVRENLQGDYKNIIVANFQKPKGLPVYVETDGTENNIGSTLNFGGIFSYNNASNDYSGLPYTIDEVGVTVIDTDPFTDAANFDFSLVDGSAPATGGVGVPSDDFYTQTDFSGAVGVKGSANDWTTGANWIKWND